MLQKILIAIVGLALALATADLTGAAESEIDRALAERSLDSAAVGSAWLEGLLAHSDPLTGGCG